MLYEEQLQLIHDFHEKYKSKIYFSNIKDNLGKNLESDKVDLRRLKKHCQEEPIKTCVTRAELCLKLAEEANYMELIKRSMDRKEICMDKAMFMDAKYNIVVDKPNSDKFCYDMVEFDAVKYLYYLRKKGLALDWQEMISLYCKIEGLNKDSETFIAAMVSYPRHTIKFFARIINNDTNFSEAEYERELGRAMKKDKGSLI